MTKITLFWIGICSIITTLLIFIFGGSTMDACYGTYVPIFNFTLLQLTPKATCLVATSSLIFSLLFFGPILFTLIPSAIYTIVSNKHLPRERFILWFWWCVFLWFVLFELSLSPIV